MALAMGRLGVFGQPSNNCYNPDRRMRLWTLVKNRAAPGPASVTR